MASAEFQCPHCHNAIKAIPLARGNALAIPASTSFASSVNAPFETHSSPAPGFRSRRGFWASLTGTYSAAAVLAGGAVWLYTWAYDYNPIWAVLTALVALFGLPVLELFLHRPPRKQKPKITRSDIRVTMQSEDGHTTYLDHFQDQTIQPEKLIALARLVVDNDLQWLGRPTVCKQTKLSQTDYAKIADEFLHQGYLLDGAGNNRLLSFRGRAFLRQMAGQ